MFDKVNLSAGVFHFKWGADSDWRLGKEDSVSTARTQLHHAVSGRPDADSFHRELIRYFSIFISQVNAWDSSAASHIFSSKRSLLWITSLCSSLKVISGVQVVETPVIMHSFCIARCPYAHLLVCCFFSVCWDCPRFYTNYVQNQLLCLHHCEGEFGFVFLLCLIYASGLVCFAPWKCLLQLGYLFRFNFPHLASIHHKADGYQHKSFLNLLLIQLCAGASLVWFEIWLCCVLPVGAGELVCHSAFPGSLLAGLHKYYGYVDFCFSIASWT